ncbi:helix-turn-helix domain-containing protein [Arthrobacter sp. ISL-5]|uniref:helix-turn-helix domain-containing protein n=1 Tax=Arthrobacter sp. ISL-5 TaxID=2819111 RepID=UPI00203595C3|nr:helix-turn-helix domain-containing protein [Arthrobacter sp. ISL-5]
MSTSARAATFTEETAQVPRRARSTRRLRDALVAAVIGSGRAAAEAASSFGVSWWLVQRALDSAALTLRTWMPWRRGCSALMSIATGLCGSFATRLPKPGNAMNRG